MSDTVILFEDKDVKITTKEIIIKCYYFPIGRNRVIPFTDILKV